ncbi:hypothetical protein [Haloplanus rubicundus]|uniref:Uncharacterized protein n=1 Tax=Haloplanus rubicundus TaxID=1547898 RepID=A0A345E8F2_9EURY|nr:hypothetical protein [Haloplanus rubicundus]AXG08474.1 hypothetical protein DU484_00670 [Haloplanus rubicundus]
MTDDSNGSETDEELPKPFEDYLLDWTDVDGLPIPLGAYVRAKGGEKDGDRNSCIDPKLFVLDGDWIVHAETGANFPVAMVTADSQSGAAVSLSTVGDHWARNAALGYDPAFGTFAVVGSTRDAVNHQFGGIEFYSPKTLNEFEEVVDTADHPVGILIPSTDTTARRPNIYVCDTVDGHQPWSVLHRCALDGFSALRERYKLVADELGESFNPTPPSERTDGSRDRGGNPERAKDLHQIYCDKFS